jgi:hypothetical protein
LTRIRASVDRGGFSAESRAHLRDCMESLQQALTAPLQRAGA